MGKPSDWVDDSMMDDPEDKKPDDWTDEKRIVDKDASKPDDWDDEEDGEWEAPMKDNPEYKGEWQVKSGTIFDNIIITDDKAEADTFAAKWKALNEVENAKKKEEDDAKKTEDKKQDEKEDDNDDDDKDDEEDKKEAEEM